MARPKAVPSHQDVVVLPLHAAFPHHSTGAIACKFRVVQLAFAHLPHIAEQMRRETLTRVEASLDHHRLQFRQVIAVRLQETQVPGVGVFLDEDRLIARRCPDSTQPRLKLLERDPESRGDQRQMLLTLDLPAEQKDAEGRIVGDNGASFAVQDAAARCQQRQALHPVLLRQCGVILWALDLKLPEPGGQQQKRCPASDTGRRQSCIEQTWFRRVRTSFKKPACRTMISNRAPRAPDSRCRGSIVAGSARPHPTPPRPPGELAFLTRSAGTTAPWQPASDPLFQAVQQLEEKHGQDSVDQCDCQTARARHAHGLF